MTRDHLAHSEAELLERVADLEVDRNALRATLHQAVHALHHVTDARDRLRRQNRELRDQLRVLATTARDYVAASQRRRAA